MTNPYQVVKDFESALCSYTGAPRCVTVNSCTNALFLCLKYQAERNWISQKPVITIPKRTYLSVPMQIKHAGFEVNFRDEDWCGFYKLNPLDIFDSARWFTRGMFSTFTNGNGDYTYVCVSFHWSKTLGIQQGGAILHNDPEFDVWARKARFDGRTEGIPPKDENPEETTLGWHMYMSPEIAAEGLVRLNFLKPYNLPLPNDDYPDLSTFKCFK